MGRFKIEASHDEIYIFKSALWLCECNKWVNELYCLGSAATVLRAQEPYKGPQIVWDTEEKY